jgi:hypothetical protein
MLQDLSLANCLLRNVLGKGAKRVYCSKHNQRNFSDSLPAPLDF